MEPGEATSPFKCRASHCSSTRCICKNVNLKYPSVTKNSWKLKRRHEQKINGCEMPPSECAAP